MGTLHTENLGIERLLMNVLSNPHIRYLILCGPDSRQAIGHLPGQSLAALSRSGLDDRSRIIGAKGKRPVLKNISREAVEHFRKTVEVVDLVGEDRVSAVLDAARDCAARHTGPAEPFSPGGGW
jgi:tetrahydromethanopterin S-methyltransferase subunit A